MVDVEWAHGDLDDLRVVDSMHDQKHLILAESGAVVALPGGCGTLEELLEAVTWKQLGPFSGPIVILNQDGFYDPLVTMLKRSISERFMRPEHGDIWRVASSPDRR
ncbi:TPA: hypothetical protein DCE37_05800 [Candidatus Latescibacteria bacterium]|nr:hypothetical protein [Candidatus Latescibacterota bacterium]|tara:strand:- start:95 stop:412 length:318 start_codon:yes stop_codon:yes gene_type:complete